MIYMDMNVWMHVCVCVCCLCVFMHIYVCIYMCIIHVCVYVLCVCGRLEYTKRDLILENRPSCHIWYFAKCGI